MINRSNFRKLILFQLTLLILIAIKVIFFEDYFIDSQTADIINNLPNPDLYYRPPFYAMGLIILYLISLTLIYFFKNSGRILYLILQFILLFQLHEHNTTDFLLGSLSYLESMVAGFTIAIMYFTKLKEEFKN